MNKSNAATERVHRTNEEDEDNWEVHAGDVVTGVIVRIDPDEILVDIGCKAEGVLSTNEVPEIGLFAFSHLRERDKILVYVLEPETQDGHAHLSIKRVPDIAFIAGGFDETFLTPLAAAVHYAARETRKEDGQVTNYEGETTAMAQAFRKAVHKQKDTSTSQERRATMTQWPNVHADNKGIVVPGTAVAPPLSNEAVIRRIEHAAATSLVESTLSGDQLDEVIVSSFIESYLHPLAAAAQEEVARSADGIRVLPRRTITEKETTTYANTRASANTISYGYEPAEIAFALRELNHNVLTKATQGVDRKTLRLTEDMLSGFSCVLGWYNLCCFLLQPTPKEPDIHWLQKFYDLSVSHASLEFNTDHVVSWLAKHLPPRSEPAPDIPCWFAWNGTSYNEEFTAGTIIAAEKNRLLAFRKSLYMYLTVVTSRSKH